MSELQTHVSLLHVTRVNSLVGCKNKKQARHTCVMDLYVLTVENSNETRAGQHHLGH